MAVDLVSMGFWVAGKAVHIGSRAVFCRLVCTRGNRPVFGFTRYYSH